MAYYKFNKSQKFLKELFSLVKSSSKVYTSLRSVLNERPPDIQNHFKNTLASVLKPWALPNPTSFLKKSLTKNFTFRTRNKSKILTTGAPLSFNYNNHSTPTYSSKTKFCTKVLCLLSFKKVSEKSLSKKFTSRIRCRF